MVDKEFLNDIEEQQAIDQIVELGFAGRKTSRTWPRNLVAAIAIIVVGIPIFGYTFPALAQHIPIVGGIFARTDVHHMDWLESIADYAVVIGEVQTSDGISFTLNEAFFNGREVYLTYLVESEQALNREIMWFNYELVQEIGVLVDGMEIPTGLVGTDHGMPYIHWLDDHSFFFILDVPLVQSASPLLYEALSQADQIEVFSNFSAFGTRLLRADDAADEDYLWETDTIAQGPWNFRIPLERSERTRIYVDQRIAQNDYEVGIRSMSITPTRLIIDASVHVPLDAVLFKAGQSSINGDYLWGEASQITSVGFIEFNVVDNLGTTLRQIDRMEQHYTGTSGWGTPYFERVNVDATQVVITPVIYEWDVELVWDDETQSEFVHKREFVNRIEFEPIIVDLP